jgi:hypothetical protein
MCLCVAPPNSAGQPDSSLFRIEHNATGFARVVKFAVARKAGSQTIPMSRVSVEFALVATKYHLAR